jgi:hypothetical protein
MLYKWKAYLLERESHQLLTTAIIHCERDSSHNTGLAGGLSEDRLTSIDKDVKRLRTNFAAYSEVEKILQLWADFMQKKKEI